MDESRVQNKNSSTESLPLGTGASSWLELDEKGQLFITGKTSQIFQRLVPFFGKDTQVFQRIIRGEFPSHRMFQWKAGTK